MPEERAPMTVGYLVWLLSTRWRAAVDRALADQGISHAQYAFLGSLRSLTANGARPSQRELAERAGLDAVYVSKLARALEAKGLVVRTTHPDDPRAVQLSLTKRGVTAVDRAVDTVAELHDELLAPLGGRGSPAATALADTLRRLLDATS